MITITAILRATPSSETKMEQALLDVAAYVAANEPGTRGFFIGRRGSMLAAYEYTADKQRIKKCGPVSVHALISLPVPIIKQHLVRILIKLQTFVFFSSKGYNGL